MSMIKKNMQISQRNEKIKIHRKNNNKLRRNENGVNS